MRAAFFIFEATITGWVAFISADHQINEGYGGSRREAGAPENLRINLMWPNVYKKDPST